MRDFNCCCVRERESERERKGRVNDCIKERKVEYVKDVMLQVVALAAAVLVVKSNRSSSNQK